MTGQGPDSALLDKIDAREQALTREAEQVRTLIDELTARLGELDEAIDHLRITRKTLLALADEDDAEPVAPPPALPDHPAYQQILAVFAPGPAHRVEEHREHPLQAQTPGQPRHSRRDRARLVHSATPIAQQRTPDQPASSNPNDERDINSRIALSEHLGRDRLWSLF
jgi:hypothetical protein